MAAFFYEFEATDTMGNRVRGQIVAESAGKAYEALVGKGYFVTWVKETEYLGTERAAQKPFAVEFVGLPRYSVVTIGGYCLIVGGFLLAVYGVYYMLQGMSTIGQTSESQVGFVVMLCGILLAGVGQVFHCVRDMARNSWRR